MDGARDDSVTIGHRWTRRVALGAIIIVMAATACTGSGSSNPTVRLDEFDAAPETNEPGTVTGSDSAPVANSGDTNSGDTISGDTLSGDTVASPSADPAAPTTTASTTTASAAASSVTRPGSVAGGVAITARSAGAANSATLRRTG